MTSGREGEHAAVRVRAPCGRVLAAKEFANTTVAPVGPLDWGEFVGESTNSGCRFLRGVCVLDVTPVPSPEDRMSGTPLPAKRGCSQAARPFASEPAGPGAAYVTSNLPDSLFTVSGPGAPAVLKMSAAMHLNGVAGGSGCRIGTCWWDWRRGPHPNTQDASSSVRPGRLLIPRAALPFQVLAEVVVVGARVPGLWLGHGDCGDPDARVLRGLVWPLLFIVFVSDELCQRVFRLLFCAPNGVEWKADASWSGGRDHPLAWR